jgi:hypothetical protein
MEAVVEPPVVPLRRVCPLVTVERNYAGGQKNGSIKGEIEWAIWDSDGVVKDEKGSFLYDYNEHPEEHALIMEGMLPALLFLDFFGSDFLCFFRLFSLLRAYG